MSYPTFEEYLTSKNIDHLKFKQSEPDTYGEHKKMFDQVHPNSFTAQKLFVINKIRRLYMLEKQADEDEVKTVKKKAKPMIKRKS